MSLPRGARPDDPNLPPLTIAGRTLHSIKFTPELFLNRTTAVFGPSNSGKSLIADNILYTLRKRIPTVVGYIGSPNDMNGVQKHFPKGSFTGKLTFENFSAIGARLKNMAGVYNKVNNVANLKRFIEKYVSNSSYRQDISDITYKMNRSINDIRAQYASVSGGEQKIQKIKDLTTNEVKNVYKSTIYRNREHIMNNYGTQLNDDELLILHYINYIPNMLCMIDDMTSKIISISKKKTQGEAFQDIFTQGRWWYLTLIMLLHADNSIPGEIKKGMFITIFTEASQVNHFFNSKALHFSKDMIKEATDIANDLYKSWNTHYRCLVYIREDPVPFRYYIGNESISLSPFIMGSDNFKKLCYELYKKDEVFGIDDNPSLDSFKKTLQIKQKTSKSRPHAISQVRL